MFNVSERKRERESRDHAAKRSNVSKRNLLMPPAPTEPGKKLSSRGLSDVPLMVQWWQEKTFFCGFVNVEKRVITSPEKKNKKNIMQHLEDKITVRGLAW